MPEGLHGAYSIEIYKNGNVVGTQSVSNAETVAGSRLNIEVKGKKKETLTVSIRNEETGKSVNYGVFNVNYDEGTVETVGSLNKDGLLAITPTTTASSTSESETQSSQPEESQPTDTQQQTEAPQQTDAPQPTDYPSTEAPVNGETPAQ